jgi:hypothetical protein
MFFIYFWRGRRRAIPVSRVLELCAFVDTCDQDKYNNTDPRAHGDLLARVKSSGKFFVFRGWVSDALTQLWEREAPTL